MFDLGDEANNDYGSHRSGWSYAVNQLKRLHNPNGPEMVSFIEKKFIYGDNPGERNNNFRNPQKDWIGFLHVPVNVPTWFQGEMSPKKLLETKEFKEALVNCKGIFTLASPLTDWLSQRVNVPISTILHPSEEVPTKFNRAKFNTSKRKRVIQLGWWLRKLHAIDQLPLNTDYFSKHTLGISKPFQKKSLLLEQAIFGFKQAENVNHIGFLPNDEYDNLLAESVVFIDFYDTAANNAIIECIARGVPILCPSISAATDYLGANYPLYYETYEEAAYLIANTQALCDASEYLLQSGVGNKLSPNWFVNSIVESDVGKTAVR
ncbi:MAG: hypothetical protein ABJJ44_06060 [Paraglaciecola sp.]|uniref:hypothetical protein n=1 Tax=Paraglaciecola sp. TaxID=1920173 RepID=UPI00329A2C51